MYFAPDAEAGKKGSDGCKILSYLPGKMLSFSWNAPPSIPEVRDHPHKAWVVVRISETEEGSKVELDHIGFLTGEEWEKTIDYFENAWEIVMNRLTESINAE